MAAREKTRDELDMKTLRELVALPSNKYCFDCGQRGPTYVNVTIGAFVCSACGGILREVEMDRIKSRGNEYCTHVWLGKYDPKSGEADLSTPEKRREFVSLKYEQKKFYVDPREAIKKMKPRAPPLPTTPLTHSQSQNNTTTLSQQKSGALPQTFSAGDVLSNAATDLFKDLENDPFRDSQQTEAKVDEASFADFSSAFGNTDSKGVVSSSSGQTHNSSSSHVSATSGHTKKPAPPPPDRYAALADLDHQQHTPPEATPFWANTSTTTLFAPPAVAPNPFGGSAWPQVSANPFHAKTQPSVKPSLTTAFWPSVWPTTAGQPQLQPTHACDPWSSQPPTFTTANPFANGSFGSANGTNGSGKNPFL